MSVKTITIQKWGPVLTGPVKYRQWPVDVNVCDDVVKVDAIVAIHEKEGIAFDESIVETMLVLNTAGLAGYPVNDLLTGYRHVLRNHAELEEETRPDLAVALLGWLYPR